MNQVKKIIKKHVGLRAKLYCGLIDINDEDKTVKGTKKCVLKKKKKLNSKFRSTSNRKQNKSFKKKIDVDSLKEFIKNNKLLILKTQQRSRSEKHNVLTEEVHKIDLRSNDDKTIQSSDSMKPHAHGTSKDIICNKE